MTHQIFNFAGECVNDIQVLHRHNKLVKEHRQQSFHWIYWPNMIKINDFVPVPHSEAEDGGHASVTLAGCVVNAGWAGNSAAGLYVAAHSVTENAHAVTELILNLVTYLPVSAQMTQYLLQRADKSSVTASVWGVTADMTWYHLWHDIICDMISYMTSAPLKR